MSRSGPSPQKRWYHGFAALLMLTLGAGAAHAQTNPAAQALPYAQDFSALAHTSTTYPAGLQGWTVGTAASAAFRVTTTGNNALIASSTASSGTGGVHNYNGKIGVLTSGSNDGALALAVNTTGLAGISVSYDIMTIRNPHDGSTNTRISQATLQYRVGTTGDFATLSGIEYQNNTTTQTGAVTTPQNTQTRSITLPPACDNQAVVQLRWVCRDVSGGGSRPSIAIDNVSVTAGNAPATAHGLQFDGVNDYVTFGAAPQLSTSNFTVETWFMRTGTGATTTTGSGGSPALGLTSVVPLIAKGRGEGDGGTIDCNYFLGIQTTGNVLAADYEHDATSNNNHALVGTTVIQNYVWYHVALTYDGATLKIYLNGNVEAQAAASPAPRSDLAQHAGLGTAMTSTGTAAGFFAGVLDEARIWNYARNQCDIVATMNSQVSSGTGLLGRWGLNDGLGTAAANSIGGSPGGTLTPLANPPLWVTGSPFNLTPPVIPPPADPTGLSANAPNPIPVQLAWTDVATTETGYQVERSDVGVSGPFTLVASLGPNATSHDDFTALPATSYWYRVRATGCTNSGYSNVANVTTPAEPCNALALNPTANGGYVTFGPATATLGAARFTLETWFKKTGTGVTLGTGTGGLTSALPLVTKGRGEGDGSNVDANYFLGIELGKLGADYEDIVTGLNHPVVGATTILDDVWYHAAATFDGTSFKLYLNGVLDGTTTVTAGQDPRDDSIQHAGLGTALNSTGVPLGSFAGVLDEVRIWNYARSESQIQATINSQISTAQSGLIGRWSMNEITGTTVYGTAGTGVHGALVGSQPTQWDRVACAPFNLTFTPPDAPSGLGVTAVAFNQIDLTWTDNASNETGFEIERSTAGIGGPYALLTTVAANTTSYSNTGLTPLAEYCYRVRAINGFGQSAYDGPLCASTPASALDLGSAANTYVTFGDPAELDLAQFTVECWFRRDGAGTAISTGGGGVVAIPLVTHGAPQADGSNVDMNYFLGIRSSDGVLCADFEESAGGASPGQNHPVVGVTPVGSGWHHAAATYDGTTWQLYLDGNLEATLAVGQPVQSASIQHAALGAALTSTGTPVAAYFDGVLDEVRVWSVVRTPAEIQATANSQISSPTAGLVARWALDEGTGTVVNGSAGTTVNGTITGGDFTWTGAAPFDLLFTPPAAPSGLAAVAVSNVQIDLSWTDHASNETGFEIEVSTTGIGGSYTLLTTVAANTTAYSHMGLTATTEYCYRIRAVNGSGNSAYDGPVCETTLATPSYALSFSGSAGTPTYASFGNPAALQLSAFTIEMWVRRDAAGVGTNTGTGGISDAIPLIAKGRAESETAAADINYLVGIRASTGALCADFEEGQAGASPSLNHPVEGATALALGTWYHVAATYDGTWKLYVNGNLDATLFIGQPLNAASTVAVAMASALTTGGTPAGYFNGRLDEVRIWNVARDQAQIQSTANAKITTPTAGLVARWGLDEGSGTTLNATAGTTANGSITGPNYAWVSPGAPFNLSFNQPPALPVLVGPANGATGVSTSPTLEVTVSDPEASNLTVSYYGRTLAPSPGPDFTLIGLPDTQYYTGQVNGGTNAIFQSQTNWIVANRVSMNIVYVGQLGDCVENGDNGGNDIEWQRADASLSILENPGTTGLTDGIPFGVSVGNHDQSPIGNPDGTTTFYNQYFGSARFTGRAYYGGHYGANNDNWYELFSASGLDFIVISFEYDTTPDAAVLAWADGLLAANPNRRAIILSHFIINTGNPGGFGTQGQAIYDALKARPNLSLMLCGHVPGEGRRQDTFAGNTVHSLLSDYQSRTAGGNGWLRIMEFSPANNEIRVKTYSPWLSQFETDGDSQFTLTYNMSTTPAFTLIGTETGVPSGSNSTMNWPGLAAGTAYEWYATVSDGSATTGGPIWSFTTAGGGPPAPIATLSAAQVTTGNDADGTIKLRVHWDDVLPGGATVEVYRARFGDYPEYDDASGQAPTAPTYPPGAPWQLTGVAASDDTDEVNNVSGYDGRDSWYYVAFVKDQFEVYSVASNLTVGRPNYLLGDVADGTPPGLGRGDNVVNGADISALGGSYGATGGAVAAVAYLDIGPTQDLSLTTRPQTDNAINFEDLVMLALNYDNGAVPQLASAARKAAPAAMQSSHDRLWLEFPNQVTAGEAFTVRLHLAGSGRARALSAGLRWQTGVVEPVGIDPGEWLTGLGGVAFSPRPGAVDAALLGTSGSGFAGEGVIASVRFVALATGEPRVSLESLLARDGSNRDVEIVTAGVSPAPRPASTELSGAYPNPFQSSATIAFSLAESGPITVSIFGVDGRLVRTLASGVMQADRYRLEWNGRDGSGHRVPAGVYLVRLTTAQGNSTKRVAFLK